MHEHFNADGVLTGTTVVTHEPMWDDISRDEALRLIEHEESTCGCGCGQPIEKAYDKNQAWKVDHFTCYAGRAMKRISRQAMDKAEKVKRPEGWDDGMHWYVEPATEADIEKDMEERRRRPARRGIQREAVSE